MSTPVPAPDYCLATNDSPTEDFNFKEEIITKTTITRLVSYSTLPKMDNRPGLTETAAAAAVEAAVETEAASFSENIKKPLCDFAVNTTATIITTLLISLAVIILTILTTAFSKPAAAAAATNISTTLRPN